MQPPAPSADIGIIGGSGLYSLSTAATEVLVDTPYGPPSGPITLTDMGGRRVAFVPRHGPEHQWPPHRVPYRANLWALRSLGVRQVLAPSAVGSLRAELGPGTLVVPAQLVDRTSARAQTYYDGPPARTVHVAFADPYCPDGRAATLRAAAEYGWSPVDGGTLVVVEGPRFSTRAESRWYADQGWSVIGMTGHPEAVLARELALCYTSQCLVTDLDAGVEAGSGVTHEEVLRVFAANLARLRALLEAVVAALPVERTCRCGHSLDGLPTGIELP